MFSKLKNATSSVELSESPLQSLPDGSVDRVAGGVGCWMEMVFGTGSVRKVWHGGYPPDV